MSQIRWADADSESEEEYVPPSAPSPELEEVPVVAPSVPTQYQHQQRSNPRGQNDHHHQQNVNKGGSRGGRSSHHHQRHQSPNDVGGRGGRGGRRGGGGVDRVGSARNDSAGRNERQNQHPRNWKEMAKASSRFSNHANTPVAGAAWMAQRQAKMEQEEKQHKEEKEQRLKHAQEEQRERRKSQMGALKAAMQELKVTETPPPSQSPETSSRGSTSTAAIANIDASPPKQILKRDGPQKQDNGTENKSSKEDAKPIPWRKQQKPSSTAASSGVSKHSYTIGQSPATQPKPLAALQPDGTVKFIRQSSVNSVTHTDNDSHSKNRNKPTSDSKAPTQNHTKTGNRNYHTNQNGPIIEFDESAGPMNSHDRKQQMHHDKHRHNHHRQSHDDYSNTSRGSRHARGGGRGRGRGPVNRRRLSTASRGGGDDSSSCSQRQEGKEVQGAGVRRSGRGRGVRGTDHCHHSSKEELPSSKDDDKSRDESAGHGRGARGGARGRGRGRGRKGRENGGRKDIGENKSSASNSKSSIPPKTSKSYEISAD